MGHRRFIALLLKFPKVAFVDFEAGFLEAHQLAHCCLLGRCIPVSVNKRAWVGRAMRLVKSVLEDDAWVLSSCGSSASLRLRRDDR